VSRALSPAAFQAQTGVSRETLARFVAYADLLTKWQEKINLVGRSTITDLWRRHFLDSAQVHSLLPSTTQTVLDLGSGAGFPGLVLALMGIPDVHLAESDNRKCAFLREAARVCGVSVTVHARRIETIPPFAADVVTARALAPVSDLLGYAVPFLTAHSRCLFLKGQNAQAELDDAAQTWSFSVSRTPSCTDPDATLLDLQEVSRHD
jgi:16S rRNA (guanine527-N7)-methyltransferase